MTRDLSQMSVCNFQKYFDGFVIFINVYRPILCVITGYVQMSEKQMENLISGVCSNWSHGAMICQWYASKTLFYLKRA